MTATPSLERTLATLLRTDAPNTPEGFAVSWLGGAWLWLRMRDAGQVRDNARLRGTFRKKLAALAQSEPPATSGLFIGAAAAPVVASLGAERDDTFAPLVDPLMQRWNAACAARASADFFSGSAGAVLAWLELDALQPHRSSRKTLAAVHAHARQHAWKLVKKAKNEPFSPGLAHGLSGVLLAAEVGAARLGKRADLQLRAAALKMLQRSAHALGNGIAWAQLPAPQCRWCNGAPGVALALLEAHRVTGSASYARLATLALHGAQRLPHRGNATFCCGAAGKADVMLEAGFWTRDASWKRAAQRAYARDGRLERGNLGASMTHGALGRVYVQARIASDGAIPLIGMTGLLKD